MRTLVEALAERVATEFNTLRGVTLRVVVHGSVASTARPSYPGPIMWIGDVTPTNADTSKNDVWLNTA